MSENFTLTLSKYLDLLADIASVCSTLLHMQSVVYAADGSCIKKMTSASPDFLQQVKLGFETLPARTLVKCYLYQGLLVVQYKDHSSASVQINTVFEKQIQNYLALFGKMRVK